MLIEVQAAECRKPGGACCDHHTQIVGFVTRWFRLKRRVNGALTCFSGLAHSAVEPEHSLRRISWRILNAKGSRYRAANWRLWNPLPAGHQRKGRRRFVGNRLPGEDHPCYSERKAHHLPGCMRRGARLQYQAGGAIASTTAPTGRVRRYSVFWRSAKFWRSAFRSSPQFLGIRRARRSSGQSGTFSTFRTGREGISIKLRLDQWPGVARVRPLTRLQLERNDDHL